MIAADEDRHLLEPLADALAAVGGAVLDDVRGADAAVLVASPRAAGSPDVDRLLGAWTADHPTTTVLVILVGGELEWDLAADTFDAAATTALSGVAQEMFGTRPLWLDARGGIDAALARRALAALAPQAEAPSLPPAPPMVRPWPPSERYAPVNVAARAPDAASGPRRPGRGWLLIGLGAAVLAIIATSFVALLGTRSEEPPPVLPGEPSELPAWLLLAAGLAIGVVIGVVVARRRRHPRLAAPHPRPETRPFASATPASRATVFISHSYDTDHQLALRLAADLRADVDVWVAPESIAPGESWLGSVERGLATSRVVLALLSRAALASPWVLKEIQAAMELEVQRRVRLVPVEVEECDIPILLRTYQGLRLASGYDQIVEQTRRLAAATS